ncbi:phage regulatory protein/antirepressor Ant [Dysgonomonas sp. GY75]|uniref:phage regulatory protein/antirepressor Ant n=1 Tax=Dysgonomonas sp. GY75 TaxID=2780419 RepID=UPI001883C493|nr:phage regulatory protein/antirepressor Ant [Dysgonomonas sp. GY75]MBF0651075.1 phage regulatory protein/antirepressor Ant [Dysgonomonas sp. GY75]
MANVEKFYHKTMSSREIAELTGKTHKNVLADCDKLNETYRDLGLAEISAGVYYHPNTGNQQHREYLLTKMQSLDLMTGYRIDLRIKVNRRWEELEAKVLPQSEDEILLLAMNTLAKRVEAQRQQLRILEGENELLDNEVKALAPKAAYTDEVLQSASTYTMTQVAKELGMSAIALERKLKDLGVMFRQSEQWLLYAKYQDKGYTRPRTHSYERKDGTKGTNTITVWTEKGRAFIHCLFQRSKTA